MLNRSASLAMSTSVLKALPGKLDIKRHSPSILYLFGGIDGWKKTFTAGTCDWKNISMLIKRHAGENCHLDASARAESYLHIMSGNLSQSTKPNLTERRNP